MKYKFIVITFLLFLSTEAIYSQAWQQGNLEIHVFKVGQAMSQLVISPTGKTMLLDCGEVSWNSDNNSEFVANEIERITGARHLNYIVISHLHSDHVGYYEEGGIWGLFEKFHVTSDKLIDRNAGIWNDIDGDGEYDFDSEIQYSNIGTVSNTTKKWICYATNPSSKVGAIREIAQIGSTTQIDLGTNVNVRIVQADGQGIFMEDKVTPVSGNHLDDAAPPSENDYSMTVWLNYNEFDFVFGGDSDGEYNTSQFGYKYNDVESIVAFKINQEVEVMSVNHHGSAHSSNPYYVNKLSPLAVFYQTSGRYGHPDQKTLDLFYKSGIDQYFTQRGDSDRNYYNSIIVDGNIVIKTQNGKKFSINGKSYSAQ